MCPSTAELGLVEVFDVAGVGIGAEFRSQTMAPFGLCL